VCHQYWPSGDTRRGHKYGEFNVSVLQITQQDGFIQRMLSVTNPKVRDKQVCWWVEYVFLTLYSVTEPGYTSIYPPVFILQSGQVHKVTQFQMSCWTPEGLCTSPHAIIDIIEQVLVIQRKTGNRPIVVHGR